MKTITKIVLIFVEYQAQLVWDKGDANVGDRRITTSKTTSYIVQKSIQLGGQQLVNAIYFGIEL